LWSDLIGHAMACRSPVASLASLWSSYVTFESPRATAASSTYWRIESWQLHLKELARRRFIVTDCRATHVADRCSFSRRTTQWISTRQSSVDARFANTRKRRSMSGQSEVWLTPRCTHRAR